MKVLSWIVFVIFFAVRGFWPLWHNLYISQEAFNVKIISKKDVEDNTNIPIVGEISHNSTENNLVVDNKSRTIISEQFRGHANKFAIFIRSG